MKNIPTSDQISLRAHQLWIEHGQQDWLDAERELTEKMDLEAAAVNKAVCPVVAPPTAPNAHTVPPSPPTHNQHVDPPAACCS